MDGGRRAMAVLAFCAGCVLAAKVAGAASRQLAAEPSESAGAAPAPVTPDASNLDSLLNAADQDVSQLSNVRVGSAPALEEEVTTVNRQASTVGKSPAAVFVITNEMIRRSGARSIPDVLRMAPGVEVARVDANEWAVSIRGFNSPFANKLLVQIDGRTVYTPSFAGVFWDVQDVLLEDVERIEVVRGPGAAIWGANAVNGVINIITKSSRETQGAFGEVGGGTEERDYANARYGGRLSRNATYRLYGKWFERGDGFLPDNMAADAWRMGRGGYRVDWTPSCCDLVTVQGDAYRGDAGGSRMAISRVPTSPLFPTFIEDENVPIAGFNNIVRWTRTMSDDSAWMAQAFYDRTERTQVSETLRENRDTVDFDFQHNFRLAEIHGIIWGGGYRNTRDSFEQPADMFPFGFRPNSRADDLFSYFVQDEITLREELLFLTGGTKFQHNDYTGFEMQPTVRLLLTPSDQLSIWGAVSRAVRTPSRSDADIVSFGPAVGVAPLPFPAGPLAPIFPQLQGSRDLDSEQLIAYELGARGQPVERFSWDLALFLNDYRRLRSLGSLPMTVDPAIPAYVLPLPFEERGNGLGYGFEQAITFQATERWKLSGAYSFLRLALDETAGEGDSARNRIYVQSSHDLGRNWELDLIWRYVDNVPDQSVPAYNVGDARLAWRPNRVWEAYVVGRNLFDHAHPEFGDTQFVGTLATEVEREVYGGLAARY